MKIMSLIFVPFTVAAVLISCSNSKEGPLTREEAIDVAARHLMGKSFDSPPQATVVFTDGKYTVSVIRPVPGGGAGETYASKVVFDAKTRELLVLEVGEGIPKAREVVEKTGEPDLINRQSALGEEKDPVEALQKQMSR